MDCNKILNNTLLYLDNELVEDDRVKFELHLKECSVCEAIYENIAATYKIIETDNLVEANPFFYHKLKMKLEAIDESRVITIFTTVLKPLAVAASITLGIIIGNGELDTLNISTDDSEIVSENFTPVLPADYSLWITMNDEDGSEN